MLTTIIIVSIILIVFLRPIFEEIVTIVQIFASFFTSEIDFKEKFGTWAVVTGCTDGIGKSFSFELAKRNLNIVLISRNLSKLEAVASEIEKNYKVRTKIIAADFSKGREIYESIKESLEGLDVGVLINNVGVQYSYPMYFGELPEDELWGLLHINIASLTQMTRIVLPKMVKNKRGAIVNLSSGSKLQPLPFMNLYAASKLFVDFFTDALRHEYRNSGLTIQSLCPYYVRTNINGFSETLMKVNIFVPRAETYAESAIKTLGKIDNTTGYWPHRLQYAIIFLCPVWIKAYIGGLMYKSMRREYLKSKQVVFTVSNA